MKKIIAYLSIIIAGGLLASCNLNETPAFSDSEAFVAFDKVAIPVEEDTSAVSSRLRVPVRLTSLDGLTSTVTYQVFEGPRPAPGAALDAGAQEGRDYELVGGSSVLTFTDANPVQYIEFDILSHRGEFTGDRTFGVKLISSGSVNKGRADSVAITILDLDHPLSFLFGTYSVFGPNYFSRPDTWNVAIEKDPEDITKVWINNLVVDGTNQKVYGIVNAENTTIKIPVKQTIATVTSYESVVLEGFDDPDINKAGLLPAGSNLTLSINTASGVVLTMDLPFGSHIIDIDQWYSIVLAEAVFTKQ